MSAWDRGNGRPHISPSQLDMYFRCGEQYRRAYVLKEKIPPGIAMAKGSACHKAAEVNYRQKIDSGVDLEVGKLLEAAATGFEESVAGGVSLSDEESTRADKALGEAKDAAVSLTKVFHRDIAPKVQPTAVEEFVRVDLPNHSHDILGRVDVVDDKTIVRDLKTSGRRKSQDDVDRSDQLTYYAIAHKKLTGIRPAGVAFDVLVETKTPVSQILTSARDEHDVRAFVNKINAMLHGVKSGVFLPAAAGGWCCSPRFCGYWATCPFVNAERKAAADAAGGF